jgi:hypothetical protein
MFNKLTCTYFNNLPTYLTHLWHTYLLCFVQSPNEWICWNSMSLNWKNHKLTWSYHKLSIPKFCNGSFVKIVLSWVHIFCTQMSCIWHMYNWDEIFSFMYTWKYFMQFIHTSYMFKWAWHSWAKIWTHEFIYFACFPLLNCEMGRLFNDVSICQWFMIFKNIF